MKKMLLPFACLLLFASIATSQTITISDIDGINPGCTGDPNDMLTYAGPDGGSPARNVYTGTSGNGGFTWRVKFENNRWEVQIDADLDGSFETVSWTNTFASVPNPPTLGTGAWVNEGAGCNDLTAFSGSGSQTYLGGGYTFIGATNSDWATASNWSGGVVPTTGTLISGDAVVINAICTMNDVNITFPSGTSLTINSGKQLIASLNTNITISSGASLTAEASAFLYQGQINNSGMMNISGSYTAFYMTNNSGGVLNILSGGSYSCPSCAETFKVGGTINNTGTLNVGTPSTWQGTINNNIGGTITDGGNGTQVQFGSSSTVNNYGTFVSRTAGTAGVFNNYASGTLTMPGTCSFTIKGGGNFTNEGSLTAGNSDNALLVQAGGILTNTGTLTNNGAMAVNASGTFTNNGNYQGSGAYSASVFTNGASGTVTPGNSAGCTSFSNGFTDNGTVTIELGGTTACTSHDKITVSGTATLSSGSTLTVTLINGYSGAGSDQATILTASALTGTFSNVNLPANWYINYTPNSVILSYGAALLPVELVRFNGREVGIGTVQLDWQTASEQNNQGFHIERRTENDNHWTEIGFVAGSGTTTEMHNYTFLDKTPLPATNYYRLRQMDFDGGAAFSHLVSVNVANREDGSSLTIFPNPVHGNEITLYSPEAGQETFRLRLYSPAGQLVLETDTSASTSVDIGHLPSGIYSLQWWNPDAPSGTQRQSKKIVVQH